MAAKKSSRSELKTLTDHMVASGELPEALFHYTNNNGLVGIVQSKELRCSEYRTLNDRTEVGLFADVLLTHFRGMLTKTLAEEDVVAAMDTAGLYRTWYIFVGSFATRRDHNFHWQAYSRRQGAMLEFHGPTLLASARAQGFEFGQVFYSIERAQEIAEALWRDNASAFGRFNSPLSKDDARAINRAIIAMVLGLGPFFKHEEYTAEEEWRIVKVAPLVDAQMLGYRAHDKHFVVPFASLDLRKNRYDLSSRKSGSMLTGVTIGPGEDESFLNSIAVNSFCDANGFKDVSVRHSKSSLTF